MTSYHVDSDAVIQTTQSAHGSIERIRTEVQALLGQLTSLEGSWSGQASVAFQSVVADWRATQQRVEESLVGITTALGSAGQQYAETEQANLRLFGR
ncbi:MULTISPECIES: WXG100 family type VII secretion target [Microbacteriaceae]|uniref:ESAT-6-like protein n=1 Tax=Orlajensenia leifsoniae TaxID=2561933 RepID=A0A4Y9R5P6_9MICO|nr:MULTISPECIES: WXG100 family type VII secretion target [Leifsonia]KQQ94162.1 type VII secretion protein [Leifsonia sp. Leaf325]TFV99951.1 WXG100 family type VII secretion target [Leifsonia flava]